MFIDDMYIFAHADQIYLYGQPGNWKTFNDRCFVCSY